MKLFVTSVIPHTLERKQLAIDLLCIDAKGNRVAVRINNLEPTILIARVPGMSMTDLKEMVYNVCESCKAYKDQEIEVNVITRTEAAFFNFGRKWEYLEIKSNPNTLRNVYGKTQIILTEHYSKIVESELSPIDAVFYRNTESPYRLVSSSLSAINSIYYLACRYDIPLVGGIEIPNVEPSYELLKTARYHTYYEVNDPLTIKRSDVDYQGLMTMISYDIETYSASRGKPVPKTDPITCIGAGVFNIGNPMPYAKHCFVWHPVNQPASDDTVYHVYPTEREMLFKFTRFIKRTMPHIITGYNNFAFDDMFVYERCKLYDIETYFVDAYTPYKINDLSSISQPSYSRLNLKIDGMIESTNFTVKSATTISVDVMKLMIKEDPKRFTQRGRANLDTMLAVYNIRHPQSGELLQKCDMSVENIFKLWENSSPDDVYTLCKYCVQDSWITGTLLIERAKLVDLIELAASSSTTIQNSVYNADGFRVNKTIIRYAYREGFAFMDTAPTERMKIKDVLDETTETVIESATDISISNKLTHNILGNKALDIRTIVGGAVKNYLPGRRMFIVALDFSSMYPSQKEASNVDTSSRVDDDMINNPAKYGLEVISSEDLDDNYGQRHRHTFRCDGVDYVVEQFYAEYKNDKVAIRSLIDSMTLNEGKNHSKLHKALFGGCTNYKEFVDRVKYSSVEGIMNSIPETYSKSVWFVQSPKDSVTLLPTINYSLKAIMLSELRYLRSVAKKELANATNKMEKMRFNAKQLAIKVLSNSEYGASGSALFSHYDPDIAAATTCQSRRCIGFLRDCLISTKLIVSQRFVEANKQYLETLKDVIKVVEYDGDCPRNMTTWDALREPFNAYCTMVDCPKRYQILLPTSDVIYQDTDSNYYFNRGIVTAVLDREMFDRGEILNESEWCLSNPTQTSLIMQLMYAHNCLLSSFTADAIHRRPIGLGFEGAFIVARYLNRKKKYYGVKWNDRMTDTLNGKLWSELTDDEIKQAWTPGKSTIPLPGGYFIRVNKHDILRTKPDYHDYIVSEGVKVTGVDLVRRDQYRFINLHHLLVVREDLRMVKREDTLLSIIHLLIKELREDLGDMECPYTLEDFSKTVQYKIDVPNTALIIVNRLATDGLLNTTADYTIEPNQRIDYVVTDSAESVNDLGKAKRGNLSIGSRCKLITEVDFLYQLDIRYYIEKLCDAMSAYVLDDIFESELNDMYKYSDKVIAKKIDILQHKASRQLLDQYFIYTDDNKRIVSKYAKRFSELMKDESTVSEDYITVIQSLYPGLIDHVITNNVLEAVLLKSVTNIDQLKDEIMIFNKVLLQKSVDKFSKTLRGVDQIVGMTNMTSRKICSIASDALALDVNELMRQLDSKVFVMKKLKGIIEPIRSSLGKL